LSGVAEAVRADESVSTNWGGEDSSRATLRKKFTRHYVLDGPVHLLLHRGFTGMPDPLIVDTLLQEIEALRPELGSGLGPFQGIWYLGKAPQRLA
jgi:hypothetical protein